MILHDTFIKHQVGCKYIQPLINSTHRVIKDFLTRSQDLTPHNLLKREFCKLPHDLTRNDLLLSCFNFTVWYLLLLENIFLYVTTKYDLKTI